MKLWSLRHREMAEWLIMVAVVGAVMAVAHWASPTFVVLHYLAPVWPTVPGTTVTAAVL